jgi:hypothetical protein
MTARDPSYGHLLGRLAVIEERVHFAVSARRRADPQPNDAFRGLYLADDQVDRLLTDVSLRRLPRRDPDVDGGQLLPAVEAAADKIEAGGVRLRLRALASTFTLTELDVDLLLVAAAPDLDPRFEKLYGYLHDDVARRRPSTGLALELAGGSPLAATDRARFGRSAPLCRHGLVVIEDADRPFLSRALRVPDRVTAHLLGDRQPDAALSAWLRSPPPLVAAEGARLARAFGAGVRLVYCRQPAGSWTAAVAVQALGSIGWDALVVDLTSVPEADAADLVAVAVREAALLDRVLVLGPVEEIGRPALRAATDGLVSVLLYGGVPWDPSWSTAGVPVIDLHDVAHRPARQVWADALASAGQVLTADRPAAVTEQLSTFRMAPDQVQRAVDAAVDTAAADGMPLTREHLSAGARLQNGVGLGRLARRVEPSVGWDDLVLPPLPLGALQHLTDRVRLRDRVLGDWRLRRAGGRGEGVTALFAGEPGTGKTMAAEVVAAELGLDLYVIDLSSVVDKYIGETEKNLERVFAGAEGVNGVLFFDEADALFGKRSEVSDARDRYANLEVAYLLQRMETFDGLAVLATNIRSNLDEAFARRLSLVVEFSRPEAGERRRLWEKSLAAVPLAADVDLDFCAAAFELAGGDIRNVAVSAAYVAAADADVVTMSRLMRAVQVEYRKLGRLCLEAEFGPYYRLLSGVA